MEAGNARPGQGWREGDLIYGIAVGGTEGDPAKQSQALESAAGVLKGEGRLADGDIWLDIVHASVQVGNQHVKAYLIITKETSAPSH